MDTRNVRLATWLLHVLVVVGSVLYLAWQCQAQEDKGAGPTVPELVQGVIARAEAVFSGRIEYQALGDFPPDKALVKTKDETFYFSGSSWSIFTAGSEKPYEVCYRGKYIKHEAVPQPNGRIGHLARVAVEQPINKEGPRLPVFAGTFWEKEQRDYVKDHARGARDKGQAEMNGVSTRILEWTVPEADKYRAFQYANDITNRGGTLRIYVAPQLGYVLPRVELLGSDSMVGVRYDAFDFFQAATGIFLPKRTQWLNYYDRKGNFSTTIFEVKKVEKINEPIPEEAFKMYLPLGTKVADTRSGVGSHTFKIQKETDLPVEGLDDIVQIDSNLPFWRRRGIAIAIGVAAGLLVGLAILFYRRGRAKGNVLS